MGRVNGPLESLQSKVITSVTGLVTVDTREVDPNMRECTFNVLVPGRRYNITVATRSGNLSASASVEGRTGESSAGGCGLRIPTLKRSLLSFSPDGVTDRQAEEFRCRQPSGLLGKTSR